LAEGAPSSPPRAGGFPLFVGNLFATMVAPMMAVAQVKYTEFNGLSK